jgi:hypothetical protein
MLTVSTPEKGSFHLRNNRSTSNDHAFDCHQGVDVLGVQKAHVFGGLEIEGPNLYPLCVRHIRRAIRPLLEVVDLEIQDGDNLRRETNQLAIQPRVERKQVLAIEIDIKNPGSHGFV